MGLVATFPCYALENVDSPWRCLIAQSLTVSPTAVSPTARSPAGSATRAGHILCATVHSAAIRLSLDSARIVGSFVSVTALPAPDPKTINVRALSSSSQYIINAFTTLSSGRMSHSGWNANCISV